MTRRSVVFVAALLVPAALASAKAPKPAETPTVEEIYRHAVQALEEQKKLAAEKSRDPDREAIDAYRDRKVPFDEYERLVEIINEAKDERLQDYRLDAARALVERFAKEQVEDFRVRAVRRDIALKLLPLMKAQKDDTGLRAIEQILWAWWRQKVQFEISFRWNDKLSDRTKAYNNMLKFLKKGAD